MIKLPPIEPSVEIFSLKRRLRWAQKMGEKHHKQDRHSQEQVERYLKAFRHTHVNKMNTDACAVCGLDLRDPIHLS